MKKDRYRCKWTSPYYLLLITFYLFTALLHAQDVSVTASVDNNRVWEGGQFRLIIEARGSSFGSMQNVVFPDDFPFTVVGGPNRSSGTQISIVNFQTTSIKTESLTYILRADRVGTHRIMPITVTIDGKAYATRPFDVMVIERTQQGQGQTQQGGQQQSTTPHIPPPQGGQQPQVVQDGSEMFILASVDKTNVYRNEMIVVHYKLYTQSNVRGISLVGEPSFADFWKEELYQADRIAWQREVYDGRQYNTFLVRSLALFPSKEGTLAIPRLELDVEILVMGRGIWGFSSSQSTRIRSNPVSIRVNPLPPIASDQNFVGAVGRFEVSSSLSPTSGDVGSTLTFRVTISGSGNFNQISAPRLPDVRGIRFMSPEINDNRNQSTTTFSGRRTFIYPVLLQESGTFTIPDINVSWFDTSSRSYRTHTIEAQTIEVAESDHPVHIVGGSQPVTRRTGSDIQFIVTSLSTRSFKYLYQTYWYWAVVALLLLSVIGHNYYILEMEKQSSDTLYRRDRRAIKVMKKYLKEANKYAKAGSAEFYNSAYIGLTHFLTDKLNIPRGSQEKEIFAALSERGVSVTTITELKTFFEKTNFIKFASSSGQSGSISADLDTIQNLINSLLSELGKKTKKGGGK